MPQQESTRRSAEQILEEVIENGRDELSRSTIGLLFSGFGGGISMGLTGLAVALAISYLGKGPVQEFISFFFYPIGFIVVIIGRAQLFTENTLFPVVLVLDERKHVLNTLRLWVAVFVANVAGAFFFGWLVMKTGALSPSFADALAGLGMEAANGHFTLIFAKGIIGGWLIALVAWMVSASHWTIGQIAVTWMLTFIVGAGHFFALHRQQRRNCGRHHVRTSVLQQLLSMAASGDSGQHPWRRFHCELIEFWAGQGRQAIAESLIHILFDNIVVSSYPRCWLYNRAFGYSFC